MKRFSAILITSLLAGVSLWGQTAELPSAPSARLPQKTTPQTAPAPAQPQQPTNQAPAQTAPAQSAGKVEDIASPDSPTAGTEAKQATAADAKAPAVEPDVPTTTIVRKVNEVNVIFTVTDKRGRFVKDLTQADFRVMDNNKPVQTITGFARETNLPLRVGLLIDASNSIRDRFTFEQESAIEFLNHIIRPKFDKAFVLGFDTTAEVTQDFTDSAEKLSKGVRALRPGGGTALWDAVYYACRDKLMKEGRGTPVRRAVILLSDGEDNQSRVTREEAIEMAQRAEVIIYTISTNISPQVQSGDKHLARLAEATGGRSFIPFKIQDVADAFSEIQDELRSQYALAYRPDGSAFDGKYHTIDIVAQNKKNLRVRARKGYYAEAQ